MVLLLVVLVTFLATGGDSDDEVRPTPEDQTTSEPSTTTSTAQPSSDPEDDGDVTVIAAPDPGAYSARCMAPTAELIGTQGMAFDGTVTSIDEGVVQLEVGHWFHGGDGNPTVEVRAPADALQTLLSAVAFEEGERFLVSASRGSVTVCGLSAPYSPRLERLYERAFPVS